MGESGLKTQQEAAMNALEARGLADPQTFVEMNGDFEGDERLCLTAVTFLPPDVQQRVMTELISPLKAADPNQHYYSPESLHITIQNVRRIASPPNFTRADIGTVSGIFAEALADVPPLHLQLSGLLKLPTSLAIRVYTGEDFQGAIAELRRALAAAGFPDDKTYIDSNIIFGNATFCRYRQTPNEAFFAAAQRLSSFAATIDVDSVSLISTNAVCHAPLTKIHSQFVLSK